MLKKEKGVTKAELIIFYKKLKPEIIGKFKDKQFKEKMIEWIECAEFDIKAAKEIKKSYTDKESKDPFLIALSVFHLQQAVEKATKVFSYIIVKQESSAEKTIRDSAHTTVLALVSALLSRKEILPQRYITLLTDLEDNLKKPFVKEGILGSDDFDFAVISKENIIKIISEFNAEVPKSKNILEISSESDESISNITIKLTQVLPLALITFSHWSFTRYPNGRIKPSNYNNLGITHCLDELISKIEDIVNNLNLAFKGTVTS